jgi:hypothetical protein
MEDQHPNNKQTPGFNWYIAKRLIIAALLIILVVWAFGSAPKAPKPTEDHVAGDAKRTVERHAEATAPTDGKAQPHTGTDALQHAAAGDAPTTPSSQIAAEAGTDVSQPGHTDASPETHPGTRPAPDHAESRRDSPAATAAKEKPEPDHHEKAAPSRATATQDDHADQAPTHDEPSAPRHEDLPVGVAFVEATIESIDHELNKRFWGWRPNDLINFTDNVNNFQLGVLEVTRRTVVSLAERISRTGTTDAFNPHLENAMNWLMVKADRYWFPAPESKYKESISELLAYKEELLSGSTSFYTRTDNLIPLLSAYEDLLGSCDENLVKQQNEDGTDVSLFKADDYFFYAKGVASTMATILEAIHHDFHKTLENRHATELLHHAMESCRQAASLDPLLITDADLDGIFANHRANMAAPISHARFYIGQLIKTLST